MTTFLIMAGVIVILVLLLLFFIGANSRKSKIIKEAEKVKSKESESHKKRVEIEEEFNNEESKILDSDIVNNGVMPIVEKPKHNHAHSEPCSPSCPAYNK